VFIYNELLIISALVETYIYLFYINIFSHKEKPLLMIAGVKIVQLIDFGYLSCKILWGKMDMLIHGKAIPTSRSGETRLN